MNRIYHHWKYWECVKRGMYDTTSPIEPEEAMGTYAVFLSDTTRFKQALKRVVKEWPISCEQFLTNDSINRIAWLGQASLCIETGLPRIFRGGFKILSPKAQAKANATANQTLQQWIKEHDRPKPLFPMAPRLACYGSMYDKIHHYIRVWGERGYEDGLPDDVPGGLTEDNLAPSYKQIAHALLKNDHPLQSLGFTPKPSAWYSAIKKVEIEEKYCEIAAKRLEQEVLPL